MIDLSIVDFVGAVFLSPTAKTAKGSQNFLGTAFPISESERLYLTAMHCVKDQVLQWRSNVAVAPRSFERWSKRWPTSPVSQTSLCFVARVEFHPV